MNTKVSTQIEEVYRAMTTQANYRPAAPSDGFGYITVPTDDLDLDSEAKKYASQWWREEDDLRFNIGCCDFRTRKATIFLVEAARLLCGCSPKLARKLVQMALKELQ